MTTIARLVLLNQLLLFWILVAGYLLFRTSPGMKNEFNQVRRVFIEFTLLIILQQSPLNNHAPLLLILVRVI